MAGEPHRPRETLHIAVLPWLAFGHLLPFLELSKALARRGHRVSFLSTPRNLRRLPAAAPHDPPLLALVPLPFPAAPALPASAEATSDIPLALNGHLKKAFDDLAPAAAAFLDSADPPVDWIIHDFTAHWAVSELGAPRRIPCALFSVFPPPAMAFFGSPSDVLGPARDGVGWITDPVALTVPPPWLSPVSSTLAFTPADAAAFVGLCSPNESGVRDSYRWAATSEAVQLVIVRSCRELDGDWLSLLGALLAKPVLPAGFLSPAPPSPPRRGEALDWLDGKPPGSVVYVAMGSEAVLGEEEYRELAHGLALSGACFLWAFRRPVGMSPAAEPIPAGFTAAAEGRGVVTEEWVPQLEILGHPSLGGFLTHCGWSSVVEALGRGLPLVLLPVFGDQVLMVRMLEERSWGKAVARGHRDGKFTRQGVAEAVRFVLADDAGEPVRAAARRAARLFADHALQDSCLDGLARYLVDFKDEALRG